MGKIQDKVEFIRSRINDNNLRYAKMDLEDLVKIITQKRRDNPELSVEDILNEIDNQYAEVVFNNVGRTIRNGKFETVPSFTRSDFFLLKTMSYLRKNPEKILEIIDQSDRRKLSEKKMHYTYTANMQENIQNCMQDLCSLILSKMNNPSFTNKFIAGELTYKERVSLQKTILNCFANFQVKQDENIRISYTRNITELAKILEANGCFETGIRRHNSRLRRIGLENLQEINDDKKGNKAQIRNMSDWKNVNIVNKLPFDALIAASAFFTNRACKEYISFKRAVFILSELGMRNETSLKKEIDVDTLREALGKYEFLQSEARDDFAKITIADGGEVKKNRIRVTDYQLEYTQDEIDEYEQTFSRLLPMSSNNIIADRKRFGAFEDIMEGLYTKKDFAIDTLIASLLNRDIGWNWGYIPEVNNGHNSIQSGKRMIALGFDVEGFNMPIRLHCSLNELRKLVKEYTGKSEIPVYQGVDDWNVEQIDGTKTDITTQVFRQTNKNERKEIKTLAESLDENDRLHGFITHLNWIANRTRPERYGKNLVVSLEDGRIKEADERNLND